MPYCKRHLESVILRDSQTFSAILVSGPPQAGKTTMMRHLIEEENAGRTYVSLEDLMKRLLAKTDPLLFFQRYPPPVVIDEIQYAPELFTYVKIHVDKYHHPGDFWLTSSQIFRAIAGIDVSLAGRVILLQLPPLSQREIIGAPCSPFTPDWNHLAAERDAFTPVSSADMFARMWRGSMPGSYQAAPAERDAFYAAYLSELIDRHVRLLYGNIDPLQFYRFCTVLAAHCAQPISYRSLAAEAEITASAAKHWLDILDGLGIVFLLGAYPDCALHLGNHAPKLYFYDTGLVCYLSRLPTPEVAEVCPMSDALVENYAISEIMKGYHAASITPWLTLHRGITGKGADALYTSNGKIHPLAVSKSVEPDQRLAKSFPILDRASLQRGPGATLCMADRCTAFNRDHLIVPLWMV